MIGARLGSYTIERELGRGGMGAVYLATHALLGRKAAIKVLLPAMSRDEVVQRFFNEARAATAIAHPGIVEVFDYGVADDGSAYIVMELLDGESLAARLKRLGPVSPEFALAVAKNVTSALAAAHPAGIVHRDLKPDNVFLVRDPDVPTGERTKLLDFGIAKLVSADGGHDMALTQTGALLGTPYYMSPEQCRGAAKVDARSDLYSLGCMLFQMVTGRVPFVGEGLGEILAAHIHVAPPSPRSLAPDLPPEVDALILRLLAKSPADRPASAEDLGDELAALGTGRRAPPRMSDPPPLAGERAPLAAEPVAAGTASERASWPAAGSRRRPRALLFVAGAALAVAAVATVLATSRHESAPQTVAATARDADAQVAPDAASLAVALPQDAGLAVVETAPADAAIARRPPKAVDKARDTHAGTSANVAASGPGLGSYVAPPGGARVSPTGGPTWPQPAPPKWTADFTFGALTVSDSAYRDEIERDFESRKSSIRYCYDDKRLGDRKPRSAKVSITVVVPLDRKAPDGGYATATVRGGDTITTDCVKAVMRCCTWPDVTTAPVTMKTSFTVAIH